MLIDNDQNGNSAWQPIGNKSQSLGFVMQVRGSVPGNARTHGSKSYFLILTHREYIMPIFCFTLTLNNATINVFIQSYDVEFRLQKTVQAKSKLSPYFEMSLVCQKQLAPSCIHSTFLFLKSCVNITTGICRNLISPESSPTILSRNLRHVDYQ